MNTPDTYLPQPSDPAVAAAMLLELYAEWGVDTALADSPCDWLKHDATPEPVLDPVVPAIVRQSAPVQSQNKTNRKTPIGVNPQASTASLASGQEIAQHAQNVAQSCNTLEALRTALDNFDECNLRATATTTIFPEGPLGGVMFVGETPDASEDRSGHAFSGETGMLLDKMLASIGLARRSLILSSALPWRPPGGRPATSEELLICRPFIMRAISLLSPSRLVLMGSIPTKLILSNTQPITRLRKRWHEVVTDQNNASIPAMVTRHPSQLAASHAARREAWEDLLMLRADIANIPPQ